MLRRIASWMALIFVIALSHQSPVQAHTGMLDAYGCHANKALYGTTAKRECHQGLLAWKVFPSATAEYKAYIAAQQALLTTQQQELGAVKADLAACKAACPPPPPPPASFKIGTRVEAAASGVMVRLCAGFACAEGPIHPEGTLGTIIAGPQTLDGYTWWQVDFDSATDGWCTEPNLVLSTKPPPPPTTSMTFIWNPNSEPDLAGYRLYCGTASRVYDRHFEVGKVTTGTMMGVETGHTYFCSVTAFDLAINESAFSNEVSKTIP